MNEELNKARANDYIESNSKLLVLYSVEELKSILGALEQALEGTTFLFNIRKVNRTRYLLDRWSWEDIPRELTGNNKFYIFKQLLTAKKKLSVTSTRMVNTLTEDTGEVGGLEGVDSEIDDSFLLNLTDLTVHQAAVSILSMCNDSEYTIYSKQVGQFLLLTEDPKLIDREEEETVVLLTKLIELDRVVGAADFKDDEQG